jgi:formate dehydrogenase iron-sulfur subunit
MSLSIGILFDSTLCIGCEACCAACKETHNLSGEPNPLTLGAETYTIVSEADGVFFREFCRHCLAPACASSCLVGALRKSPEGPVIYDEAKCIGCRYCLVACPYGIPRYQWEKTSPLVRKCDFCIHLLARGDQPACAEVCPTGATLFGKRDELLRKAHGRIKAHPDRYYPRVFGEKEAGGSSVLFIADRNIAEFGLKVFTLPRPLPDLTWRSLNKVPAVALTTGALLGAVWWITRRRKEVSEAEAPREKKEKDEDEPC